VSLVKKRNPRLDGTVKQALADLIETELADPRLTLVTLTEVQVSQDAKEALVYYSTLDQDLLSADPARTGGDALPADHEVAAALEAARPRLQSLLAKRVRMRNTPVLRFEADPVVEQASRVEALLAEVRRERGEG
jgi:ribosome-binding factor A